MKTHNTACAPWLCVALLCATGLPATAGLIINGGFESGFTSWTLADQLGGDGAFHLQAGTLSPLNGLPVPAPPEGASAAMTDAFGPGSHVLYQDFVVPTSVQATSVRFSIFVNNLAEAFSVRPDLDFAATSQNGAETLNQQARIDILTSGSDPFSVGPGDVLLNLFQTNPGDPLLSGYDDYEIDITALLQAHAGQTLRLRFAEVDNVAPLNLGVDNVSIESSAIPEPSTWLMMAGALLGLGAFRRRLA